MERICAADRVGAPARVLRVVRLKQPLTGQEAVNLATREASRKMIILFTHVVSLTTFKVS